MEEQVTRKGCMSLAVEVRHAMHALPGAGRPAYDPAQADYAPQLIQRPKVCRRAARRWNPPAASDYLHSLLLFQ